MASELDNDDVAPKVGDVYNRYGYKSGYKVLAQLGKGYFSSVWLAEHIGSASRQIVAMKVPKATAKTNSDLEVKLARQEIQSMRHAEDEDGMLEKILLPSETLRIDCFDCTALIFNDLCGPSVHEYATGSPGGRLPFVMAQRAISDLVAAVEFLHCRSIGHGDIHTWNALLVSSPPTSDWDILAYTATRKHFMGVPLDDLAPSDVQPMMSFIADNNITFTGAVKLADFGGAFHSDVGGTSKCRIDIKAPERLEQKACGLPSDVWSLACAIIELVTGKPCFAGPEGVPWQDWTGAMFLDIIDKDLGNPGSALMKRKVEAKLREHGAENVFGAELDASELLSAMLRRNPEARADMGLVTSQIALARHPDEANRNLKTEKSG